MLAFRGKVKPVASVGKIGGRNPSRMREFFGDLSDHAVVFRHRPGSVQKTSEFPQNERNFRQIEVFPEIHHDLFQLILVAGSLLAGVGLPLMPEDCGNLPAFHCLPGKLEAVVIRMCLAVGVFPTGQPCRDRGAADGCGDQADFAFGKILFHIFPECPSRTDSRAPPVSDGKPFLFKRVLGIDKAETIQTVVIERIDSGNPLEIAPDCGQSGDFRNVFLCKITAPGHVGLSHKQNQ